MKHFLKRFINSCLLLFFVLFQVVTPVQANRFQTPENDISVNISVDKASIMVNESTKLRIEITNQSSVAINLTSFSFTLPIGLEYSSDINASCNHSASITLAVDNQLIQISSGIHTMAIGESCYLSIDVKGVQINNYSMRIGIGDIVGETQTSQSVANSTGASTTLSVTDSNGYTATPTHTPTDQATATPSATNTPLPTNTATNTPTLSNTATAHPTNTTATTSIFTSTPYQSTSTVINPSVVPTRTKKPTIVALVSVVTLTITKRTTSSLTATTTMPTSIASTPTLPAQTTDSVPDAPSTQGNLPISLLLGGGLLLLGAVGYGIYSLIKK